MLSRWWPLILVCLFVLWIYSPVLGVYFSQDDFFHFKASLTDGKLESFINLFGFPSFSERGYAFYRPVFREGLFNIYYQLFGLNHLPFRLLSISIHLINTVLVYTLMQKIFAKKFLSLFTAFFFRITAANVALLYYLAGGIQALGVTMFMLLTLICWWQYLQEGKIKWWILSLVVFLLSLASHELAITTPFLMLGMVWIKGKNIKMVWPFFLILLIFIYLDFVKIGLLQKDAQYQAVFSLPKIINSFAWYTVWAAGMPEMLIDFIGPKLSLNPNLMKFWGDYFKIIFPAFFLSIGLIIIFIINLWRKNKSALLDKKFIFLLFWFPIAISPVILLPLHKSTYYLAPALPAFWGVIGYLIFSNKMNLLKVILITSLVVLSVTSIKLGDRTYPAAVRGRIAEKLINNVLTTYPTLPKGAIVYFVNDPSYPKISGDWGGSSRQAAYILNNSDALQLLYHDFNLKVFYEDLGGIPKDILSTEIKSIVAKIQ
ncbi:glycosyltransferase family 39 protein [Candidatus Microgenomates bacterium]|nr:glycosyltransferase family 39 protein [Candidatus Microgenomates bacterium]